MVWVKWVLRRIVGGGWRFNILSGSYLQSHVTNVVMLWSASWNAPITTHHSHHQSQCISFRRSFPIRVCNSWVQTNFFFNGEVHGCSFTYRIYSREGKGHIRLHLLCGPREPAKQKMRYWKKNEKITAWMTKWEHPNSYSLRTLAGSVVTDHFHK